MDYLLLLASILFFVLGVVSFVLGTHYYRKSKKMLPEPYKVKVTQEQPPKKEEPPKPTTRTAIMKVVLVNNKTDKEYIIESVNDFGLKWAWVDENGNEKDKSHSLLCVQQNMDVEGDRWWAIGRFLDFSILNTERKTFPILTEEVELINQQKK